MDAPKKFSIRSFLDRIKELRKVYNLPATVVCSTTVHKKNMVVFAFPGSLHATLTVLASC